MKNHKRLKKNWNKEDLTIMLWVTEKYNQIHSTTIPDYVRNVLYRNLKIGEISPSLSQVRLDLNVCSNGWG